MSARPHRRGPRRVSPLAALGGVVVAAALVAAIVAGLEWLAHPADRLPELDPPAEPEGRPVAPIEECPDPERLDEPAPVTAAELIECPRVFHGRAVTYRGEAVRAVLRRDEWAWLHVNDDPYALDAGPVSAHRTAMGGNSGVPVRVPLAAADDIEVTGDARHHGALVEVTGVWRVEGAGDGGAPAIRAGAVEVVEPGHAVVEPSDPLRARVAAVLAAAAALVTAWSWLTRGSARAARAR